MSHLGYVWYSLVRVWHVLFSQLFGRTVKASIAVDNGRATEFIKRRNYTDKTKCYECGVSAYSTFYPVRSITDWLQRRDFGSTQSEHNSFVFLRGFQLVWAQEARLIWSITWRVVGWGAWWTSMFLRMWTQKKKTRGPDVDHLHSGEANQGERSVWMTQV